MVGALGRNGCLGGLPTRCVSIQTDADKGSYVDVTAYEIHGRDCPGDPDTRPRIASLRYLRKARIVLYQDNDDDSFSFKPFPK